MKLNDPDYVVLGFLHFRPMTGYELKTIMDETTGHFYRPSFGGIYPGLARLAKEGCVAVTQTTVGGKLRKTYRPLPAGRKAFQTWLKVVPDITRGPGYILAKMFFWGLGDRAMADANTHEIIRLAEERIRWLEGVGKSVAGQADGYQTATCRFGMDYYRFLADWFGRLAVEP
jgi:DNA-binding PadR family transcriptional regulator